MGNYKGDEALARDCDPNYAKRQACDEKFRAIFAPVDTFTLYDPRFPAWTDTLDEKLAAHIAECGPLTNANKTLAIEKQHILETVVAPTSPTPEVRTSTTAPTRSTAEAARPSTPVTQAEPRPGPLAAVSPEPDPDVEAVRQYKLAADRGDAEAQLNLGKMYEAGRGGLLSDPREAARLYKLSADQGYAAGQLQLAYMYENGDVLPKDWPEAARLYRLAADQGNPEAQANLADFYERGDAGLRRNACEAMRLRKLAAAQGNAYAAKNLKEASTPRCKS
jgi:hypothetical protein